MSGNNCCRRVFTNDRADYRGHMCTKAAKVEREGKWYCGLHDPVAEAVKSAKRDEKLRIDMAASSKRYALERAAPAMLTICQIFLGHDDRFQVSVGGNPIAVDEMLAGARAVVAKATGKT